MASATEERVGIGVVAVRDGEVLLGLRRGAHGAGTWSFAGGHPLPGESAEDGALRELYEETGLAAANPRVVAETHESFPHGVRYRTIFVQVDCSSGEPVVREPDRCREWDWFSWDEPPLPLFAPVASLRAAGFRPDRGTTLGVVEAIHIAAAAGKPVRAVDGVRAIAGVGLEGDRYAYGLGHYDDARVSRDLTLVEAEVIEELAEGHGIELGPGETRRNLTTRGVRLNSLLGRRFWVGDVLCEGTRLCEPCQYLAKLTAKPLLRVLVHRGGLRADILRGGSLSRGDRIRLADEA